MSFFRPVHTPRRRSGLMIVHLPTEVQSVGCGLRNLVYTKVLVPTRNGSLRKGTHKPATQVIPTARYCCTCRANGSTAARDRGVALAAPTRYPKEVGVFRGFDSHVTRKWNPLPHQAPPACVRTTTSRAPPPYPSSSPSPCYRDQHRPTCFMVRLVQRAHGAPRPNAPCPHRAPPTRSRRTPVPGSSSTSQELRT